VTSFALRSIPLEEEEVPFGKTKSTWQSGSEAQGGAEAPLKVMTGVG